MQGYGMITLVSTLPTPPNNNNSSSSKVVFFYASLYLIALAQGADRPCDLAFAADQFDLEHPRESAARCSLYNWYYFSTAIGIAVAVTAVSYMQENVGWGIGFGALYAIMLCSLVAFLVGIPTYRLYAPKVGAEIRSPFVWLTHGLAAIARTNSSFPFVAKGHQQEEDEDEDDAIKSAEARGVLRLLPIWVTCLAYGVVFAQVSTLFNKQCRTLDLQISGGLELPPGVIRVFGPATILVFVPIYDRVLVRLLRRATGNPSGLTPLQRMGTGMALSIAAVSVAALVECQRLETAREHDDTTVPMNWVWLVPQYVIIGMADVLALVGMQEFFHDQMPAELRSLGLALFYSVIGVGSFISGALISLIDTITKSGDSESWFADDLNRAHLDYFYWLLAGISADELALYLHFARSYTYMIPRRP